MDERSWLDCLFCTPESRPAHTCSSKVLSKPAITVRLNTSSLYKNVRSITLNNNKVINFKLMVKP